MKKKVLIASLSDPSRSPRPRRAIGCCLDRGYETHVLCPPVSGHIGNIKVVVIPPEGTSRPAVLYRKFRKILFTLLQSLFPVQSIKESLILTGHGMKGISKQFDQEHYDLIIVEDLDLLVFALSIRKNSRILLDAREYYPLQRENSVAFNLFQAPYRKKICSLYLNTCDIIATVSPGLASKYQEEFNVTPRLLRSVPVRQNISVGAVQPDRISLVHHGVANRNRQLEKMIEIASSLREEFHLDMYLAGSGTTINSLKKRIRNNPRIRILPPVSFEDIIPTLSRYDIGLYYLEPNGFNLKHSLPNKLFEFIQARLAVAIGPSPDMAEIVSQYNCGFISESFTVQSMSDLLNNLSREDIRLAKNNSDKASHELCFEKERVVMDRIFDELIR